MKFRMAFPLLAILCWGLVALLAGILPLEPDRINLEKVLVPPDWQSWLGYDDLGRAIVDRLVMGARTSLLVAICVVFISAVFGTLLGILAGFIGGRWDQCFVIVLDIFMAFPGILLAIALAGLLGPGILNAVIALSIVGWVGFARLARAQTLSIKHREHIMAAHALGTRGWRIGRQHILPLVTAPLIVEATFAVAATVIAEASLSFLGLGVQAPAASWGSMIREGTRYMLVAPHMVLAPGIAICVVVLSINLLGDQFRDRIDVRQLKPLS